MVLESAMMVGYIAMSIIGLIQSGIQSSEMGKEARINDIYQNALNQLTAKYNEKEVNVTRLQSEVKNLARKAGLAYDKVMATASSLFNNYTTGGSKQELYSRMRALEAEKEANEVKYNELENTRTRNNADFKAEDIKAYEDSRKYRRNAGEVLKDIVGIGD